MAKYKAVRYRKGHKGSKKVWEDTTPPSSRLDIAKVGREGRYVIFRYGPGIKGMHKVDNFEVKVVTSHADETFLVEDVPGPSLRVFKAPETEPEEGAVEIETSLAPAPDADDDSFQPLSPTDNGKWIPTDTSHLADRNPEELLELLDEMLSQEVSTPDEIDHLKHDIKTLRTALKLKGVALEPKKGKDGKILWVVVGGAVAAAVTFIGSSFYYGGKIQKQQDQIDDLIKEMKSMRKQAVQQIPRRVSTDELFLQDYRTSH